MPGYLTIERRMLAGKMLDQHHQSTYDSRFGDPRRGRTTCSTCFFPVEVALGHHYGAISIEKARDWLNQHPTSGRNAPMTAEFDSRTETLAHSRRVGELIGELVRELTFRMVEHDLSKLEEPEVSTFNQFTPLLRDLEYGSEDYYACLRSMAPALEHHYALNPHHPEFHRDGIRGMTLVDLVEMLADWKAASERHEGGNLGKSLDHQRERFGIDPQLDQILWNTARRFEWV